MADKQKRAKRTRLSPEARHEQLLGIGLELLFTRPIEELTVEAVAAQAGVSKSLIFHYFPTIRDLHLAVLEAAAAGLVEELLTVVAAAESSLDKLIAGVDAFVAYIEQQPGTFDALSMMASADPDFGQQFQLVRESAAGLVSDVMGGEPDAKRRYHLAGWVSYVETVARRWVSDPAGIERSELLDSILTTSWAMFGNDLAIEV